MKKFLLIMLMLLLAGCSSNLDKLNGKWQCDTKQTLVIADEETRKQFADPLAVGLLEAMLSKFQISVDASKKEITIRMGGMEKTEPFTVESESGNKITLKVRDKSVLFDFFDNDTFIFSGATGGVEKMKLMVFKRVKP